MFIGIYCLGFPLTMICIHILSTKRLSVPEVSIDDAMAMIVYDIGYLLIPGIISLDAAACSSSASISRGP
ncbi:hypothetical protein EDC04DRAFT_350111 [Pisolithus marmoratus]|nr:hypothetical protein EDC04DRAFT_1022050 [Pisolithus marmoratus]KAI6021942.1 hypothetical protein EDC04DRAFT_350111 [Pisolithus marmoratus]